MAECESAPDLSDLLETLQPANQKTADDDAFSKDVANVNKVSDTSTEYTNGVIQGTSIQLCLDTTPLSIDNLLKTEKTGIIAHDNTSSNNNANSTSPTTQHVKHKETNLNLTEKSTSPVISALYKNVTTVTGQVPFHPAVNGPLNTSISNKNHSNSKDSSVSVKTKPRRGISFPKDTFISGYFEPPDPWKNAPSWNTDDLIAEYKASCELHGTKPIVKVLQQLNTISTPGKREEMFSLKGEKLDQRQCESLEEVLRRVQFKLVDLESSNLNDECAVALFDMIEYYESACQLNISCNKDIGARGWQACSRLVRRTPTLTYLDLRSCDMNDRTIPIFGRALKLGCHLTILHMEKMNLSGRPLIILVAALKMNETLQELFLADNKLMPTDGAQLGNLMKCNHKLSLLDLRNNHLQDVGVGHICDGLIEQNKGRGLRTLVLWNNQITYQAMPSLGRTLVSSESLETLNVGHNNITNEGVHLLKDGLLKTNTLLRLGLQGTKVSDEGAVALAEYIADSLILLRIDLRDNEIKTGGLMALSHAMRVNISVTRIDLDKETKRESGMKDYAEVQTRLQRDIITFQQRNVQSAIDREDAERAKLEEMAEAAGRNRQKEEELDQNSDPHPDSQSEIEEENTTRRESFTVISKDEVTDNSSSRVNEVSHEKQNCPASDSANLASLDASCGSQATDEHVSSETTVAAPDSSEEQQHLRPKNLFSKPGLHPQESLDSPLPCAMNKKFVAAEATSPSTDAPASSPPSELNLISRHKRNIGTPPGDMLLSPQYYPKQLARKIFSVSRVSEDGSLMTPSPSSSPSSSPEPEPANFDPLNISCVPLHNSSTFNSSCLNKLSGGEQVPQKFDSVTPRSLVHDLATETVKQLESDIANDPSTVTGQPNTSFHDSDGNVMDEVFSHTKSKQDDIPELSSETSVINRKQTSDCIERPQQFGCDISVSSLSSSENNIVEDSLSTKADVEDQSSADMLKNPPNVIDKNSKPSNSDLESTLSSQTEPRGDIPAEAELNQRLMNHTDSFLINSSPHTTVESVDSNSLDLSIAPLEDECSSTQAKCNEDCSGSLELSASMLTTFQDSSFGLFPINNEEDPNSCNNKEDSTSPPTSDDSNVIITSSICTESNTFHTTESTSGDIPDIDNGVLSPEEEPWLTVGDEEDQASTQTSNIVEKEPDFFTTLSLNGLTQELASALTSLDGTTGYGDGDIDDSDLCSPDDFERELDAMLAVVKTEYTSPLQDS